MPSSDKKKENATSKANTTAADIDKKLETDMPLSEKDEVKKAEHRVNKAVKKS